MFKKQVTQVKKTFDLLTINIDQKETIFALLVSGKLLFLPILYIFLSLFDLRGNSIFHLADLSLDYEKWEHLKNVLVFGKIVPNAGFRALAYFINSISSDLVVKYFIYGFISLALMSLSQALVINYIFKEKSNSPLHFKIASVLLSIFNFYILIYSFKASSDVFGCLGIVLFILAFAYKDDKPFIKNQNLILFILLLTLSLFRNTLFLLLPTIFIIKSYRTTLKGLFIKINLFKFLTITLISCLIIFNIYQSSGYFVSYISQQLDVGVSSAEEYSKYQFDLNSLLMLITLIIKKIIFLLSARESVGLSGNWFIIFIHLDRPSEFAAITNNVFITNILPAFILLSINVLGLASIFTVFSSKFRNGFLYSLIPLIPVLSFAAHHRYFLPYSLFTSAALPFIFDRKSD